jgi:hypothetical protein
MEQSPYLQAYQVLEDNMKHWKLIIMALILSPLMAISAGSFQAHEVGALPDGCRLLGEVKVGDIAIGKARPDVVAGLKKEAEDMGGNYVLMDVKRVNNPKQGIYYWGWGTVGLCK